MLLMVRMFAVVVFAWLAAPVQAAGMGRIQTFDTTPPTSDWSTLSIPGIGANPSNQAELDAIVQTNAAAGITNALPTSGTVPPSANALARRNTAGNYLQSRPTGNAATLLMATLVNDTLGTLTSVDVIYRQDTFNQISEVGAVGLHVYYSFDGLPGSWQKIAALSGDITPGQRGTTLDLSATAWAAGATMYLLFADDNDNGNTDPSYTIDDFFIGSADSPPRFTQQPTNTVAEQCRGVSFTARASGSPPLTFQWLKDGIEISTEVNLSATSPTLVISNVQSGDAGSYSMRVSSPFGTVTSTAATLTVNPDITPPRIVGATFDAFDPTRLVVTFSEPVGDVALDNFYWIIDSWFLPDEALSPVSVTFNTAYVDQIVLVVDPPRDVTLHYVLTALADIPDRCTGTNALPSGTAVGIANPGLGFREGLSGYAGTQDTEIHSFAPDTPGGTSGGPDGGPNRVDNDDQFGFQARALLRFSDIFGSSPGQIPFGASISAATLTVGTADPGTFPVLIFRMLINWDEATTTWNTLGDGIDNGTNGTEAVFFGTLNPGQDETTDNIDVTSLVQEWANGAPNYGWAFVATGTDGWSIYTSESASQAMRPRLAVQYWFEPPICSILMDPQPVAVNEGQSFALSVVASGTGLTYQWFKNGVAIAGATSSTYTVNSAKPSLHAGTYRVVVSASVPPSPCTSRNATVTVAPDTVRPLVIGALGNISPTTMTITFADQSGVNEADAENTANYTVSGGVTVNSAVLNGLVVTLTTSPRTPGNGYSLTIRDIHDNAEASNVLSPNPTFISTVEQHVQILAKDATWKYLNDGSNLDAVNWQAAGYDDSAWLSATALLGLETSAGTTAALFSQGWNTNNLMLLSRTNSVGGGLNGTNITDYFRTTVNVPFSLTGAVIQIRHVIDDGAVFYFNGTEVGRFNMPSGQVGYLTNAFAAPAEGVTRTLGPLTGLVTGNNTIAVEVHQNAFASADVVFGTEVVAIYEPALTLSIVNNGNGTVTLIRTLAAGTLQQSSNLTDWTNTANQANPQTVPATGNLFFRIGP
jgi:hypothetical protein